MQAKDVSGIPHADQAANVKVPDCLGATHRASVRTEKTKSPGGRVGLSAHVKMNNRLHREKEATCSPETQLWL